MTELFSTAMTDDHRRCDRLLASVEGVAEGGDWVAVGREAEQFRDALERHFRFEEEALFPALEVDAVFPGGLHAGLQSAWIERHGMVSGRTPRSPAGNIEDLSRGRATAHCICGR